MSKYMLFWLEKESLCTTQIRRVKYAIFSTNSPAFRRAFKILIPEVKLGFESFIEIAKRVITIRTLKSKKRGTDGHWELGDGMDAIVEIGVGGKNFNFREFLLKERDQFSLQRSDGKEHLERDFEDIPFHERSARKHRPLGR